MDDTVSSLGSKIKSISDPKEEQLRLLPASRDLAQAKSFFTSSLYMGSNLTVKVCYGLCSGSHWLKSKGVCREAESVDLCSAISRGRC